MTVPEPGHEIPRGLEGAVEPSEKGQDQFRRGALTVLRESVIVIGMALLLSLIVKTWLMQAFYIPSESMENTLLRGDRVVVSKLTPSPIGLKRGDVIVFEDPDHWLPGTVPILRSPLAGALNTTLTFVGLLPSDEGNHRAAGRPRRVLRPEPEAHGQRCAADRAVPLPRRRTKRAALRHHRPRRAGLGDGRPSLQLSRLPSPR
jgi:signal peptidase I